MKGFVGIGLRGRRRPLARLAEEDDPAIAADRHVAAPDASEGDDLAARPQPQGRRRALGRRPVQQLVPPPLYVSNAPVLPEAEERTSPRAEIDPTGSRLAGSQNCTPAFFRTAPATGFRALNSELSRRSGPPWYVESGSWQLATGGDLKELHRIQPDAHPQEPVVRAEPG